MDSEADHELGHFDTVPDPGDDIDDLIDELEDMSDSGPEMDTVSVVSTPKPRLRYVLHDITICVTCHC